MTEWIDTLLAHAGPWLLPLLGVAAFVEYVFPPFPGDLATVIGAFVAVHGQIEPPLLIVVTSAASVLGAGVDYAAGVWLKNHIDRSKHSWVHRLLPPEKLERIEAQYRRWGVGLVLVNRFLPGTRAFIFVFAGVSRIPLGRTLMAGGLSAVAWNALLIALGYKVGENRERLFELVSRIQMTGLIVVGAVFAVALGVFLWRRRATR
jgi:membrane-associated protein